jgi:hypothetical protein
LAFTTSREGLTPKEDDSDGLSVPTLPLPSNELLERMPVQWAVYVVFSATLTDEMAIGTSLASQQGFLLSALVTNAF